ncbi:hypothetical protein C5688_13805 [Methylocystis sp. MitZ-2018]|nr:hypothetical protein C5688_13805 [Methylocystis sp. MitZ-2018]
MKPWRQRFKNNLRELELQLLPDFFECGAILTVKLASHRDSPFVWLCVCHEISALGANGSVADLFRRNIRRLKFFAKKDLPKDGEFAKEGAQ